MRNLALITSLLFSITFLFSACEEDDEGNFDLAGTIDKIDSTFSDTTNSELSDDDVISGLKQALTEGTDSSTSILSKANGYFGDEAVKLLLPDEMETAINSFKSKTIDLGFAGSVSGNDLYNGKTILGITIDGVKQKEDDLILGLNQAAEFAAATAGPVFKDAIVNMSITDGLSILKGTDTSATTYLKDNTYNGLFTSYEPIMDEALAKFGVVALYEDYVTSYNGILETSLPGFGSVSSLTNVNTIATTDISKYGTEKALDGLFLKVSEEEKNIRKNPFEYVSDIIQKVFGSLFD